MRRERCAVVPIGLTELLEQLACCFRHHYDDGVGNGQLNPVVAIPDASCSQLDLTHFGELAGVAQCRLSRICRSRIGLFVNRRDPIRLICMG